MLTLHHAEELEPLLDELAALLRVPPADPFAPEVVVVPAAGMRDAVMAGLAMRNGVVANVEFVFPGTFVGRALSREPGAGLGDADPWAIERLTWYVLEELERGSISGVPGRRARGEGIGGDRWALARRIADLFDRYATHRPALLRAWASGIDSHGTVREDGLPVLLDATQLWQPQLFRAVRHRIDAPNPAELLPGLLEQLRVGAVQPALPGRAFVVGLASLSSRLLAVLQALGAQSELHVFVQVPSASAWVRSTNRLAASLQARTGPKAPSVITHVRHPLLASWGLPVFESRALIGGLPGLEERPTAASGSGRPARNTFLRAIQMGIRTDTPPGAPEVPAEADPADGTLQVHACHGAVRQLEVLRDALGHLFVNDPSLTPRDVTVLCPDLERFAPLVAAVFSRGSLPIPVVVGDRSLTTQDPLVAALHAVLHVVSGRATLSEVLGLMQSAPVRTAAGWDAEDVERLSEWCVQLGARWGLEAEHRTSIPTAIRTGTWRQMVDRLLAGIAMPAPTPRAVPGDISPYDHLSAADTVLVGGLANLIARLGELHDASRGERTIDEWVLLLHDVVNSFFAVDRDEQWRLAGLHADLHEIRLAASRNGGASSCDVPLSLADLQPLLQQTLGEITGRPRLRSGAVTVTSLIPQRGVPSRVVCLLGMDDGAVQAGVFDGDDILGIQQCIGERHPRYEGRHLLLDAVLSATEHLIITCNGADVTTNRHTPFVVPLVELLDVARAHAPAGRMDKHGTPVVVHHPRHGFGSKALTPGLAAWTDGPFTFDPEMLAAATAQQRATIGGAASWTLDASPPVDPAGIAVGNLAEALVNPTRTFLRDRLEVRLPGESEPLDDGLAIGLEALTTSSLGRGLLEARRAGRSADEWRAGVLLDGTIPPGELGRWALNRIVEEVAVLEREAAKWGVPLFGTDHVSIQRTAVSVDGKPVPVVGDITGVHDGRCLVDVRFVRPRASHRLALALRLAILQHEYPEVDWTGVLITRSAGGFGGATAACLRVAGRGKERTQSAERFLEVAAGVFAWMQFDAVPLFERASEKLATDDLTPTQIGIAETALDSDLDDEAMSLVWGDLPFDELLAAAPLPADPPAVRTGVGSLDGAAPASRAVATAQWVWGAYSDCFEIVDPPNPESDGAGEGNDDAEGES